MQQDMDRLNKALTESRSAVSEARGKAESLFREAAVNNREACQLRFDRIDGELQQAKEAYAQATRLKNIWTAARPLARCWEEQRQAQLSREQLARKQKQYAPDLARLKETATNLANAIDFEIDVAKNAAAKEEEEIKNLERTANELQIQAQRDGESAAKLENSVKQLADSIANADSELCLLRNQGVLSENEYANDGRKRIVAEIRSEEETISAFGKEIEQKENSQETNKVELSDREKSLVSVQFQVKTLDEAQSAGLIPENVDTFIMRRFLTGALAWSHFWFDPNGSLDIDGLAEQALALSVRS